MFIGSGRGWTSSRARYTFSGQSNLIGMTRHLLHDKRVFSLIPYGAGDGDTRLIPCLPSSQDRYWLYTSTLYSRLSTLDSLLFRFFTFALFHFPTFPNAPSPRAISFSTEYGTITDCGP